MEKKHNMEVETVSWQYARRRKYNTYKVGNPHRHRFVLSNGVYIPEEMANGYRDVLHYLRVHHPDKVDIFLEYETGNWKLLEALADQLDKAISWVDSPPSGELYDFWQNLYNELDEYNLIALT